jgi:long-chain fatty acid transport protein
MHRFTLRFLLIPLFLITLTGIALATNGDTLISVAPTARSMGGTGVAAPLDAISAIFANPAAMCMGPYCPGSQSVFAGTYYNSTTKATVNGVTAESQLEPSVIPAVGITAPITNKLRFGFGAYGISGMGVDYREVDFLGPDTGAYTNLQVMKFAPNLAYQLTPALSIGASLQLVYGALDLGQGTVHNYTIGGQAGAIYKTGPVSLGVSYTTPEKINHKKVANLDLDVNNTLEDLALESPHTIAAGIALQPTERFLIETDVKWLNWSRAAGYRDFDWEDQWVYAIGMQYKDPSGLSFRTGYNYSKSPIKLHDNFDPNFTSTTKVQGAQVPTFAYEYLRIVGFPGIQEHHVTAGIGYKFSKTFEMHFGYMHAFKNTISESSAGGAFNFASEMSADTFEVGLVWNYPRVMAW